MDAYNETMVEFTPKSVDDERPVIMKETKNKISVDYEGKMTVKERMLKKLKTSNTWIKVVINVFRFILMLGVSYVILFPFFSKVAGSFMSKYDVVDPTVSLIPKNCVVTVQSFCTVSFLELFFNNSNHSS